MKILVLAPHTDDGQFGCGGTIARFIGRGAEVAECAFSFASDPVIGKEWRDALDIMGVDERIGFDYPVRYFPTVRQAILEDMIRLRETVNPEIVFAPSTHDTHQDHEVVREEAFRAFKGVSILGYELPWNNIDFCATGFMPLTNEQLTLKRQACNCFESQKHRPYFAGTYIHSLAKTRGVQSGEEFAEAFEVIRWKL